MKNSDADNIIAATTSIWGENYVTNSDEVQEKYNTFATTGSYDKTFYEWGYVGPQTAAAIMLNYVPLNAVILDAACGSGLTGVALKNLGYKSIQGIDISDKLLTIAEETNAYESLQQIDMQELPLPISTDTYDAVNFIGALTYFETEDILIDLCRVVVSGGIIVFSQRDDIMRDKDYQAVLDNIEHTGAWKRLLKTEPMPYLPKHPKYKDEIKVQYFVYKVL